MSEPELAFKKFKDAGVFISDQWLKQIKAEYVYASNRLEGNALTLLETKTVIENNLNISGKKLEDVLETLGHYRALNTLLTFTGNKYPLTEKAIKQLNADLISPLFFNTDKYNSYKEIGQIPEEYKIKRNKIIYELDGANGEIVPLSNENNVSENMTSLFSEMNTMKGDPVKKAAYMAFQIFYNQPFPDGNKRMARLAVTYSMMKEGYPLVSFRGLGTNFNEALLRSYISKDIKPLTEYIRAEYTQQLLQYVSEYNELGVSRKQPKLGKNLGLIF